MGAPSVSSTGTAYVIFGQSRFPSSFDLTSLNGDNGFVVNGISRDGQFGFSLGTGGDINGDGKNDLVLGAPGVSNSAGAAYVIFGVGVPTLNSLPVASIIGGTVGGVFGLGSLRGLGYFLYRRCSPKRKFPVEHQTDTQSKNTDDESTPLISDKHLNSSNNSPYPATDNVDPSIPINLHKSESPVSEKPNQYRGVFFPAVQEEEKTPHQENAGENPSNKLTKVISS